MEVFKWMALPETQKAISVCHIQAVGQWWAPWCFLWDNVLRDAPQHFAKLSKKLTRIAEKPQRSGFQRKWCQISSACCVEKTPIILFLMWWLRHFTSKCEQVTTGFHSTNCGSSALRQEKKKASAWRSLTHFTTLKNPSDPPSVWREALFCFVWRCSSMVSGDKTLNAHTPMFQHRDWYKTVVYGALICNVAGALSRQSHGGNNRLSRAHIRSLVPHCCAFPPRCTSYFHFLHFLRFEFLSYRYLILQAGPWAKIEVHCVGLSSI